MQAILNHLLDLQAVDIRLLDVRTRLAALPARRAEIEAHVAAAKAELEKSKAAQIATIKDRKRYEIDVEQWKDKVGRYKSQLYEVKTNEAYKTLQHEIQMGEAEIAKAEDRLLEQMMASEIYDPRVLAAQKALAEAEASARIERAAIETEQAVAEQELAKWEAQRAEVVTHIPEALADHYARIAKKHGGIALSEVHDEICSQCGVRIRPHTFQEMRREGGEELIHCETCTRILYYIEPSSPGASAPNNAGPEQAPPRAFQ